VAIALDGGVPESGPDGLPGQLGRVRFDSRIYKLPRQLPSLTEPYVGLNSSSAGNAIPGRFARTESSGQERTETESSVSAPEFDASLVKESFGRLLDAGAAATEYLYGRLFAASPDTQSLFPMEMSAQREHFFAALSRLVWSLDTGPGCAAMLVSLGREHRKFGVTDRYYDAFFSALGETICRFDPDGWQPEVESAWRGALRYASAQMRAGAAADAATAPAWWVAEIADHDLRSPGVAVLRLAPTQPLPYAAGQHVSVQVTRWPRVWRPFSAATAPRPDGIIELHVRAVPGGLVSNTLVHHSAVGDTVLLGAADGSMVLADSDRDLVCVAGGTGLAPIKAIIEQAIVASRSGRARRITLFFGARQHYDLYDLADLQLLESAYPYLRVIPVLSEDPAFGGLAGLLPDVVHAQGSSMFQNCEAYICGPPGMVRRTATVLAASIPPGQLHYEPPL
jgi:NAD(P)H-flavin reductase/hemoglobin-like flavoprotein